jgi:ParB-like chromosome segregation protein Spo0J
MVVHDLKPTLQREGFPVLLEKLSGLQDILDRYGMDQIFLEKILKPKENGLTVSTATRLQIREKTTGTGWILLKVRAFIAIGH